MDVPAFWLNHPLKGDILIDTGFNDSYKKNPPTGDYPLLLCLMSRLIGAKAIQKEGKDI